jgi:hypothetical protein
MINLKKNDAVADAVRGIMEKELVGNQKKLDKNHNGKLDSQDFKMLRGQKKASEEVEGVEEGWDEMLADVKKRSGPQPSGGSGVKQGSRYGGSKQKEKPEQDEDEPKTKPKKEETSYFKERLIERAMLKMAAKKAFKALTGGSDEDQLKALQKRTGVPQTGKKPEPQKEEVDQVQEVAPPGFEGTVKAMKKYKKIDNPFALAWSMKNKGYKSHKKADGSDK